MTDPTRLVRDQIDQAADTFDAAYWPAYSEAVRNAPSNRSGRGINGDDARAAGHAGRVAGVRAVLDLPVIADALAVGSGPTVGHAAMEEAFAERDTAHAERDALRATVDRIRALAVSTALREAAFDRKPGPVADHLRGLADKMDDALADRRALDGATQAAPRPGHRTYTYGQSSAEGDACHDCSWQGPLGSRVAHERDTAPAAQGVPLTEDPRCPDPSVHGNPFRYCPYCSWTEADQ